MPFAIFRLGVFARQVPANGKSTISHEMPKQGELAEVANPSDLPNLHRASKHITDGAHFSGAIGPQFCRLSRKSHKPTPPSSTIIGASKRAFSAASHCVRSLKNGREPTNGCIPAERERSTRCTRVFRVRLPNLRPRRIRCVVRLALKQWRDLGAVGDAFSLPNLSATSSPRTNRVLIGRNGHKADIYESDNHSHVIRKWSRSSHPLVKIRREDARGPTARKTG